MSDILTIIMILLILFGRSLHVVYRSSQSLEEGMIIFLKDRIKRE